MVFSKYFQGISHSCHQFQNLQMSNHMMTIVNFVSKVWNHRLVLSEFKRQSEKVLFKTIHEQSTGNISKDTENYIFSLNRPLSTETETVKRFATNKQIDAYNRNKIIEFPGIVYEFLSEKLRYLDIQRKQEPKTNKTMI